MKKLKCMRCEYEWEPIIEGKPKVCPRCKSYYWETKSRNK